MRRCSRTLPMRPRPITPTRRGWVGMAFISLLVAGR
jgi:hypothetical protein